MSDRPNDENHEERPPAISGAITYPERSGAVFLEPNQPRPARNLQDLLRYSTEVADTAGESSRQNLGPLDEEVRSYTALSLYFTYT